MYRFQVSLHARAAGLEAGPPIQLDGVSYATLQVPPGGAATPFAVSFEEAVQRLTELERMHVEPDGWFLWGGPVEGWASAPRWQVEGNLYDRQERLLYVPLKGSCPPEELDRLLRALGWPETPLMYQLTAQAVYLDEVEFRRFASD
jgi:hypothetical protein